MQQTEMMEGVERQGQKGKRRKKENSPKQYLPSYEKQQQLSKTEKEHRKHRRN